MSQKPSQIWRASVVWARMIKLEHSVFALPFALMGAVLAAGGMPPLWPLLWLCVGMVGVRSFAMTLDRLADVEFDRQNPRTAKRALVTGEISMNAARIFAFLSVLVFLFACGMLNRLALSLAPVPIVLIIIYCFSKRFTWTGHFMLGAVLGFAPVAGWISVDPAITPPAVLFFLAVTFWAAGFDMIFSCQDVEFDKVLHLHSAPACFGIPVGLLLAAYTHVVFMLFLALAFWTSGMKLVGVFAWLLTGAILFWQHTHADWKDLPVFNRNFTIYNGLVSCVIFVAVITAAIIR